VTIATARVLLDTLDAAFDAAVATVALHCAKDGRLDNERLDAQQWASYELALAAADLLAARTRNLEAEERRERVFALPRPFRSRRTLDRARARVIQTWLAWVPTVGITGKSGATPARFRHCMCGHVASLTTRR